MSDNSSFPILSTSGASSAMSDFNAFVKTLMGLATQISVDTISSPSYMSTIADRSKETMSEIWGMDPGEPEAMKEIPNFTWSGLPERELPSFENIDIPEWSGEDVDVDTSGAPGKLSAYEPGDTPEFTSISKPEKPSVDMPTLDALLNINIPSAPAINSITPYDGALPDDGDLAVPTNTFAFVEEKYTSDVITSLSAALVSALSGEETEEERLVTDRTRDRAYRITTQKIDMARRLGAASGFPLPQPFVARMESEAYDEAARSLAETNRELAIKKTEDRKDFARLALENEKMLADLNNAFYERQLNAQKTVADLGIALFNAAVTAFNAKVAAFNAGWDAYAKQLQSLSTEIEIYKGLIQAELAKADINKALVDKYIAEMKAVETQYNLYVTEMKGAEFDLAIQKMELEKYSMKLGVRSEQVKAWATEWEGYKAKIEGETAKVAALEGKARVFSTQAQAAETKAKIKEMEANAIINELKIYVDKLQYRVQGYNAQVAGIKASNDSSAQIYSAKLQRLAELGKGLLTAMNAAADSEKANVMASAQIAETKVKVADANIRNALQANDLRIKAAAAGAEPVKGYIVAAISAMTNLAAQLENNVNYSGYVGDGTSLSQ